MQRGVWKQASGEKAIRPWGTEAEATRRRRGECKSRGSLARPGAERGKEGPLRFSEGARPCGRLHLRLPAPESETGHFRLEAPTCGPAFRWPLHACLNFSVSAEMAALSAERLWVQKSSHDVTGGLGSFHPWLRHVEGPPPFVARLADSQGERAEGALEDFHEPGLEVEATKFLSLSQGKARRHDICGWSGSSGMSRSYFCPFCSVCVRTVFHPRSARWLLRSSPHISAASHRAEQKQNMEHGTGRAARWVSSPPSPF